MSTISWGFPNQQQVTDQQVGGLQQYKEVTITSAQLVNDLASGIELLPEPGSGLYIQLVQIIAEVLPPPTATDLGGVTDLEIRFDKYGPGGTVIYTFDSSLLSDTEPVYAAMPITSNIVYVSANQWLRSNPLYLNAKVFIQSYGGTIVSCDTDLKLKIWYITRKFG